MGQGCIWVRRFGNMAWFATEFGPHSPNKHFASTCRQVGQNWREMEVSFYRRKGKIVAGRKVESQVLVNCLVSRCSLFIFTLLVSVYGNQILSRSSLTRSPCLRVEEHIWLPWFPALAQQLVWDRSTWADTNCCGFRAVLSFPDACHTASYPNPVMWYLFQCCYFPFTSVG